MNDKLRTSIQSLLIALAIILPAIFIVKTYNKYQEFQLWKRDVTTWIERQANPAVNATPILVTIVCEHYKEDCLKVANQAQQTNP